MNLRRLVFVLPTALGLLLSKDGGKQDNKTLLHIDTHRSVSSVMKSGYDIHYDPSQPWSHWWRSEYAGWEKGTFDVFRHFLGEKVVLDVGAWIGPTAIWAGHLAQHVIALEPTSKAFSEFTANLAVNPEVAGKVVAVNAALDSHDRTASMSNSGNSMDRMSLIDVRAITIDTLLKEYPVLQKTGFVKIDTEGYERVIVPALENFFKEKKPVAYVSLHPMFISHLQVQKVVDKLKATFPYLYEADMKTPFNTQRDAYNYGDHGGADVLCTWTPLV